MNNQSYNFDSMYTPSLTRGKYAANTFGWMFLGLMTTFFIALWMIFSGAVFTVLSIPFLSMGLLIAELAVVITLSRKVFTMSVGMARVLFFTYAALNGVVFSSVLLAYGLGTSIFVFGLTALYFGGLAAYGYVTKRDLSGMRSILMTGLIFLLVVSVLSLFLPLDGFDRIVCLIGIAIFLGFTAYDTQKMKEFYDHYAHDEAMLKRAGVLMALQLYLDFINLFLYLLRFMGNRKN